MSANKKKIAIVLVPGLMLFPGFRTSSLSCGIWNQLELWQQRKQKNEICEHNSITAHSCQENKSIHIYEIDWSSYIGHSQTSINPFYQAYLTFTLLWNLLCNIFNSILNFLKLIFNYFCNFFSSFSDSFDKVQIQLDYRVYICSAFTTPSSLIYFIFLPIFSLYILTINLFVIFSILYEFFEKITIPVIPLSNDSNIKEIIFYCLKLFFEFVNYFYNFCVLLADYFKVTDLLKLIFNELLIKFLNILLNLLNFIFPDFYGHLLPESVKLQICSATQPIICSIPSMSSDNIKNSLLIIFIFLWIVGVAKSKEINKVLEFYLFVNNYCRKELLRVKIRLNLLRQIDSIFLNSNNYQDIIIISHSFGSFLATDLLAHIESSKKIKYYSLGNTIGTQGIIYYNFVNKIVKQVIEKYEWTDYYACFDFFATKVPILNKKKYHRFSQKMIKYPLKLQDIISSLFTTKFHLVYFLKKSKVKDKNRQQNPLDEIMDDIYSKIE
ncbi:hypothetical protein [Cyanothece sp. BG0011]|uniref:hypothetical protein n=1 Tax=Cyanothece sp. BG0011 TaxID=2082950 RepID=UPI0018E53BA8|nr:hypothetical protein [Cyanothece sp. BG0011]